MRSERRIKEGKRTALPALHLALVKQVARLVLLTEDVEQALQVEGRHGPERQALARLEIEVDERERWKRKAASGRSLVEGAVSRRGGLGGDELNRRRRELEGLLQAATLCTSRGQRPEAPRARRRGRIAHVVDAQDHDRCARAALRARHTRPLFDCDFECPLDKRFFAL